MYEHMYDFMLNECDITGFSERNMMNTIVLIYIKELTITHNILY